MRWNNQPAKKLGADPGRRHWILSHQYLPSRVSKCVGLPRLDPPCLIHSTVQRSMDSRLVAGGPSKEKSLLQFPVRDVSLSAPAKCTDLSNSSPRRKATVRTWKGSSLLR